MTEFLLVRHGETNWNRDRRFQGHADPGLNRTGREQARALADELAGEPIVAIYASDLARARETAEIIGERVAAPVVLDRELREIDVGEWQGLTWPEVEERYPEGVRRSSRMFVMVGSSHGSIPRPSPSGESPLASWPRVKTTSVGCVTRDAFVVDVAVEVACPRLQFISNHGQVG